jgi:putative transposase
MTVTTKPGWHRRGYLPHFDANNLYQHIVLSGSEGVDLTDAQLGRLIENTVRFFDGERYDLQAWCIMRDHVHVGLVVFPEHLLGRVIWSWKAHISKAYNAKTVEKVSVFAPDYFDRYVRTLDQAERLPAYIESNPVKSGLVLDAACWRFSSAWHRARGWEAKHHKLPIFLPSGSR